MYCMLYCAKIVNIPSFGHCLSKICFVMSFDHYCPWVGGLPHSLPLSDMRDERIKYLLW